MLENNEAVLEVSKKARNKREETDVTSKNISNKNEKDINMH